MSEKGSPIVGYVMVEADDLLKLSLERYKRSQNNIELLVNGTIPKHEMAALIGSIGVVDPKNIGLERFNTDKPIYLDSWSELFAMGCMAIYFNAKTKYHWKIGIGIEVSFNETSLREKYLGDGILASEELEARQVFQECKAQNLKGPQKNGDMQDIIIKVINGKLVKHVAENGEKGLVVTVIGNEGAENKFDFHDIYNQTLAKQRKKVFDAIYVLVVEANPFRATIHKLDDASSTKEKFVESMYAMVFEEY